MSPWPGRLDDLRSTADRWCGRARSGESVTVHLVRSDQQRYLIRPYRAEPEPGPSGVTGLLSLTTGGRTVHATVDTLRSEDFDALLAVCRATASHGVHAHDSAPAVRNPILDPLHFAEHDDESRRKELAAALAVPDEQTLAASAAVLTRRHDTVAFAATDRPAQCFARTVTSLTAMFETGGARGLLRGLVQHTAQIDPASVRHAGTVAARAAGAPAGGSAVVADALLVTPTVAGHLLHLVVGDLMETTGPPRGMPAPALVLRDDPRVQGGPFSGFFDEEGTPTRRLTLLDQRLRGERPAGHDTENRSPVGATGHARRLPHQTTPETWPSNAGVNGRAGGPAAGWTGLVAYQPEVRDTQENRSGDLLTLRWRIVEAASGVPRRRCGTLTVTGSVWHWCAALQAASAPLGYVVGSHFATTATWLVLDLSEMDVQRGIE